MNDNCTRFLLSLTKSYNNLKEKLGFKTLYYTLSYVKEEMKYIYILILSIDDEIQRMHFYLKGVHVLYLNLNLQYN
jgi:hypothetical protein